MYIFWQIKPFEGFATFEVCEVICVETHDNAHD